VPDYPQPRKRYGQHFLTDPRILARIAEALRLTGAETVVEIGPGRGALTEYLLRHARRVVAIEIDRDLVPALRTKFTGRPLEVIEGDVLDTSLADAAGGEQFVLAGNVPYYITTPILFHALQRPRAARAVYLVQREVAERVIAPPGSDDYGALSVNVQALAFPEIVFRVPSGAFTPPPKVESAVLRVTPLATPAIAPEEESHFRTLVQSAFGFRRKQMRRVVRTVASATVERAEALLAAAGIEPEARPETLTVAQFAALSRAMRRAATLEERSGDQREA
jgi:16S rRNA (adenine1518-N6/adenine1519-N6)-dimethyltransferase